MVFSYIRPNFYYPNRVKNHLNHPKPPTVLKDLDEKIQFFAKFSIFSHLTRCNFSVVGVATRSPKMLQLKLRGSKSCIWRLKTLLLWVVTITFPEST